MPKLHPSPRSTATENSFGVVRFAKTNEANNSSNDTVVMSPKDVADNAAGLIGTATTSAEGVIELATDAEAIAATATDKALTPANLAADGMLQQTTVSISTAEMKAIETTPKVLVAAQAGKVIEFVSAMIVAQFNGVAFDDAAADGDLLIQYTTATTAVSTTLDGDGFVDAVANTISTIKPITTDYVMAVNDGIELINDGAAYTGATADTTFSISVVYRVWDDQL